MQMPVLKVKNNGEWQDTFGISSHTHKTDDIINFPDSLPSPNKLIIEGAVSAEYDGSQEVTISIPGAEAWNVEATISDTGMASLVDATPAQLIDAVDNGVDVRLYIAISADEVHYYHVNERGVNSLGDYVDFVYSNAVEIDTITVSCEGQNMLVVRYTNAYATDHINNNDIHVTTEQKALWDAKANADQIPTSLKNPYKLTFTGSVTAEYDGSQVVTVDIPVASTPVKGVDYFTEEDKAELLKELSQNNDDSPYTNLIPTAVRMDDVNTVLTGDDGSVGYLNNTRWSSSGSYVSQNGIDTTGAIPAVSGDIVRLKNITMQVDEAGIGGNLGILFYTADLEYVSGVNHTTSLATTSTKGIYDDNGDLVQFTVPDWNSSGTIACFFIKAQDINEKSIITVNEEIPEDGMEVKVESIEESIIALDERITVLENTDNTTSSIPDYWQEHLDEKAAQIREAVLTAGRNKSAFFFYSDSHWSNDTTYTAKMAPTLLKYLCKNTPINKTNFGGDIVSAEGTDVDTMAYLWQWRKLLHGLNHHSVPGNHDDGNKTNNLFSEQYVYGYLLAPEETADIVRGDGGLYYYMDNPAEKTRYLYLDTAYQGVTDAQQTFVKSALLSAPQGWHIVAIAHLWYYNDYSSYPPVLNGFDTNAKKLLDMFDSYNARGGENDEYAACGGKVELCIGGHYHLDHAEYTDGGIPVIIVEADALHDRSGTMPKAGTTDEAAVSAVVLDYAQQKVKLIRIGRGADFVVDLTGGGTVTYYSVTGNLTNASLSADTTRVESGMPYSATLTATAGNLTQVTVTMGGEDITASVYDAATGQISIPAVTGNVVITAMAERPEADYNNVLLTSIGSDGAIFNGGKGWAENSRIGSGVLDTYIGKGEYFITGHIQIDPNINNTIRLRNITFKSDTTITSIGIAFYDASFARIKPLSTSSNNWTLPSAPGTTQYGYDPVLDGTNIVQFTFKNGVHIDNPAVKYIAICAEYIGDDSIITVNEEIN
jgi:hypothetical protein